VIGKLLRFLLLSVFLVAAAGAPLAAAQTASASPANNTIVVDDNGDSPCSSSTTLRCAITLANLTPFTNIRFTPAIHTVVSTVGF